MSTELELRPERPVGVYGDIAGLRGRYEALVRATNEVLREGVDYGTIPGAGTNRVLLKPGAEKLSTLFGLRPDFPLQDSVEDWEHGRFYYRYKCVLTNADGMFIASAEGSCNSMESKYRWRQRERTCPVCGQAAIIKGRDEYGGGWLCFKKRGGCGAKFKDGNTDIEGQPVGRIENPEPFDLVNTIQKMAQKRALVAAVLVATGASEFFTQDLDDFVDADFTVTESPKPEPPRQQAQTTKTERPTPKPQAPAKTERPAPSATVRGWLRSKAKWQRGKSADYTDASRRLPGDQDAPPDPKFVQRVAALVGRALTVSGEDARTLDNERHSFNSYVFGVNSTGNFTDAELRSVAAWLEDAPGAWECNDVAAEECRRMFADAMREAGQTEFEAVPSAQPEVNPEHVQALLDLGVTNSEKDAAYLLEMSTALTANHTADTVAGWADRLNESLNAGGLYEDAIAIADAWLLAEGG